MGSEDTEGLVVLLREGSVSHCTAKEVDVCEVVADLRLQGCEIGRERRGELFDSDIGCANLRRGGEDPDDGERKKKKQSERMLSRHHC